MEPHITKSSWLMVCILGFVWGSTFMGIEIALRGGIAPFWLATGRLAVATIVMGGIWLRMGGRLALNPDNRPTLLQILWAGAISSGIPFLMLNWGQMHVTSGFAGTAMATVPIFVLPLAHFMVAGERMNLRKVIGVVLGVAGVWTLVGQTGLSGSGAAQERWGQVACIAVALCYAVNSITIRRLPPVDPIGLTTVMMAVGTLITLPFAILAEGMPVLPTPSALWALLGLGVLSTAAMNFLRVLVIQSAGPTFLTLVNYQVPVWSVVLGAWLLDEPLPPSLIWGLALILTGVALGQLGALQRLFLSR